MNTNDFLQDPKNVLKLGRLLQKTVGPWETTPESNRVARYCALGTLVALVDRTAMHNEKGAFFFQVESDEWRSGYAATLESAKEKADAVLSNAGYTLVDLTSPITLMGAALQNAGLQQDQLEKKTT